MYFYTALPFNNPNIARFMPYYSAPIIPSNSQINPINTMNSDSTKSSQNCLIDMCSQQTPQHSHSNFEQTAKSLKKHRENGSIQNESSLEDVRSSKTSSASTTTKGDPNQYQRNQLLFGRRIEVTVLKPPKTQSENSKNGTDTYTYAETNAQSERISVNVQKSVVVDDQSSECSDKQDQKNKLAKYLKNLLQKKCRKGSAFSQVNDQQKMEKFNKKIKKAKSNICYAYDEQKMRFIKIFAGKTYM